MFTKKFSIFHWATSDLFKHVSHAYC